MYHRRTDYLRHLKDPDWADKIEAERGNIRQENATALSYSTLWLGLASVLVALVAQLFGTQLAQHRFSLLAYIVALFLISIVLLLTAVMLFWHGSSTDHTFKQYAELNENGDSLVMVGSLLIVLGLSFLCSYYLLAYFSVGKWISLYAPVVMVAIGFALFDFLSVRTNGSAIVRHYIVEASRFPFYRWSQRTDEGLIRILDDEKKGTGLFVLGISFLILMIVPIFLI
jgi:hypothetical protein